MNLKAIEVMIGTEKILKACMVKPGESVVIYADTSKSKDLVDAFYASAVQLGAEALLAVCTPRKPHEEPLGIAKNLMKDVGMVVDLASNPWLYSRATNEILEAGTRLLQVNSSENTILRRPPLDEITKASDSGAVLLSGGREIRIASNAGTDLMASCVGRRANSQDGVVRKRGEWDSACTAIVGIAPLEDDVEGIVVLSEGDTVSMRPHKFVVENTIKLTVRKGRLVETSGGREARYIKDWLRSFDDPNSYVFAHTGFGTDPRAQVVANESAEWESVAGGVNIAFGSNIFRGLGGKNYAKSHMDIVLFETTMSIGDREIVLDGKLHL